MIVMAHLQQYGAVEFRLVYLDNVADGGCPILGGRDPAESSLKSEVPVTTQSRRPPRSTPTQTSRPAVRQALLSSMSTRLKRKLADLGVDASSAKANESFCLIGTPLPPLEKSKDTGEFVPLWKQEVRDEKGRRRLHGAFTGGFSAGYFNTVGSKEGWTPSTFVSSRGDRAKQKAARPEDFMDEEDLQELRDSRKLVDTTDEMDFTAGNKEVVDEPENDSVVSALQTFLLPPPTDSAGARILKKMGWRMGQGIGPRISLRKRKLQDLELSFGGRVSNELANIPDDDEEASKHTYAPRDTPVLVVERKDNSHGLGYKPGMGLHETVGGRGVSENAKGPRISAGFGLGALNDADEDDLDVYDGGTISNRRREAYDIIEHEKDDTITIGGKTDRQAKASVQSATSVAFFRDGQPVLPGFVLSEKPVSEDRWFPIPDVPIGWKPDPQRVWDKSKDKENVPSASRTAPGGRDSKITADERGAILGETPLPAAPRSVFDYLSKKDRERLQNFSANRSNFPSSPNGSIGTSSEAIKIPRTEPHIAEAALRGFQPFTSDPVKHSRYNTYLQSQVGADAGPPVQPLLNQRTDEFNKEIEDYAKAALLFKPMSSAMAGRFTSAAVVETGPKIHEGLHTPSHEEKSRTEEEKKKEETENLSPKAHAARMGMYGPLTRETKPWQPAKLLCKRFKVRDPNPEPEVVVPAPAAPGSNWQQPDIPMGGSSSSYEAGSGPGGSTSMSTRSGLRDISNVGLGEDDDQGRDTLTYERPTMDVFKAIFASDDEDSDDENEKDEAEGGEEPSAPTATTSGLEPSPASAPPPPPPPPPPAVATEPVDLSSFKPTFIPREGKGKKDKDKDADKAGDNDKSKKEKKEKRKREKEKRVVLSFALDEEGGDEMMPKPPKDRPKKKRQKKEKGTRGEDEDEGMWVEKPAADAVKDLVVPPPSRHSDTENDPDPGELLRGRKRAVDFL
ncbi:hypothetical protein C0995_014958 [Termitomyces sp. Mi166|nr:hypothetical protein C0995_014958 [Termitomyces sp. Mi166\